MPQGGVRKVWDGTRQWTWLAEKTERGRVVCQCRFVVDVDGSRSWLEAFGISAASAA